MGSGPTKNLPNLDGIGPTRHHGRLRYPLAMPGSGLVDPRSGETLVATIQNNVDAIRQGMPPECSRSS
jgi:hypothetical protein